MDGQVAHQIALMAERFAALRTLVGLLLGLWRHVIRIMVQILMPLKQLLLTERLVAELALELLAVGSKEYSVAERKTITKD